MVCEKTLGNTLPAQKRLYRTPEQNQRTPRPERRAGAPSSSRFVLSQGFGRVNPFSDQSQNIFSAATRHGLARRLPHRRSPRTLNAARALAVCGRSATEAHQPSPRGIAWCCAGAAPLAILRPHGRFWVGLSPGFTMHQASADKTVALHSIAAATLMIGKPGRRLFSQNLSRAETQMKPRTGGPQCPA